MRASVGKFLALDFMLQKLHFIDLENPGESWSAPSGGCLQDMQLTGNGELLVSRPDGWAFHNLKRRGAVAREVKVANASDIMSAQALKDGRVVAARPCGKDSVETLLCDKSGGILGRHAFAIGDNSIRSVRRTSAGTWLLGVNNGPLEIELSDDGEAKALRRIEVQPGAFMATRLGDGRYLAATGYGKETWLLDRKGGILKKFGPVKQPEGMQTFFHSGYQLLKNGNLLQCNWNGHNLKDYKEGWKLMELSPDGELVWSWFEPKERVGALTRVIALDDLDVEKFNDDSDGVIEAR